MMSTTVTVEEAQARQIDLIRRLAAGDEIVITADQRPVARLVAEALKLPRAELGCDKGCIISMSPDLNLTLEDFGVGENTKL